MQADLLDSEIEAERVLLAHGFDRAAGAVAGVVLEKHMAQVRGNHAVPMRKRDPSILDLDDALMSAEVFDIPSWRNVQRLGELRSSVQSEQITRAQ